MSGHCGDLAIAAQFTIESFHDGIIISVDKEKRYIGLVVRWSCRPVGDFKATTGGPVRCLTKSQQLSIIKVTIDIRVLKVYIA